MIGCSPCSCWESKPRSPGSAALCRDGDCLAEVPLELDGLRHAQALPPVVATLLADHHVNRDRLIYRRQSWPGQFHRTPRRHRVRQDSRLGCRVQASGRRYV
ncbi:MAG: hypothetical protein CM1200mP2_43860 [Planctomycetaceae bacterium]|nr:MAG: hypothetical protein CM1200mP2_43860 [Planctomycetaceae bacterium]